MSLDVRPPPVVLPRGKRGSPPATTPRMLWCGERPDPRRILVSDDLPLDHLPDPAKRFTVLASTNDLEISVELMDDVMKTGVVMDGFSTLGTAADITLEIARITEVVASQVEDGTVPVWKQLLSERGPHGEVTAKNN